MTNISTTDPRRNAQGQWLPGKSPGRKPGSKNRKSLQAVEMIFDAAPVAFNKLRDAVENGEWQAVRFVCEYCLPKGGRPVDLGTNEPNAIVDAMTGGEISPDEGARMAQAVKIVGDAAELKELKRQVEELELLITALQNK